MPSHQNCTVTQMECRHCHSGGDLFGTVAGDGNCGYRAVAVGLVVAIAGLSAESRRSFLQHLQQLYSCMQQEEGLWQFSSASGGNAHQGFSALRVCPPFFNTAKHQSVDTPTAEHQLVSACLHCTCILRRHMLCKLIRV